MVNMMLFITDHEMAVCKQMPRYYKLTNRIAELNKP